MRGARNVSKGERIVVSRFHVARWLCLLVAAGGWMLITYHDEGGF